MYLVKRNRRDAIGPLENLLLQHRKVCIRKTSAWALGEIGDTTAVDALIEALFKKEKDYIIEEFTKEDPLGVVRLQAVKSLGKLGNLKAKQALEKVEREDADNIVKATAAAILKEIKEREDASRADGGEDAVGTEETFAEAQGLIFRIGELEGQKMAFSVEYIGGKYRLSILGRIERLEDVNDKKNRGYSVLYDSSESVYYRYGLLENFPLSLTRTPADFLQNEELLIIGPGSGMFETEFFAKRAPGVKRIVVLDIDYKNTRNNVDYFTRCDEKLREKLVMVRHNLLEWRADAQYKAVFASSFFCSELFTDGFLEAWKRAHSFLQPGGAFILLVYSEGGKEKAQVDRLFKKIDTGYDALEHYFVKREPLSVNGAGKTDSLFVPAQGQTADAAQAAEKSSESSARSRTDGGNLVIKDVLQQLLTGILTIKPQATGIIETKNGKVDLNKLNNIRNNYSGRHAVFYLARDLETARNQGYIPLYTRVRVGVREIFSAIPESLRKEKGILKQELPWEKFFEMEKEIRENPDSFKGNINQIALARKFGITYLPEIYLAFGGVNNSFGWTEIQHNLKELDKRGGAERCFKFQEKYGVQLSEIFTIFKMYPEEPEKWILEKAFNYAQKYGRRPADDKEIETLLSKFVPKASKPRLDILIKMFKEYGYFAMIKEKFTLAQIISKMVRREVIIIPDGNEVIQTSFGTVDLKRLNNLDNYYEINGQGLFYLARDIETAATQGYIRLRHRENNVAVYALFQKFSSEIRARYGFRKNNLSWKTFCRIKKLLEENPQLFKRNTGFIALARRFNMRYLKHIFYAFKKEYSQLQWSKIPYSLDLLDKLGGAERIVGFQVRYGVKLEYAIKAFKKYSTEPERLILEDAYKYGKQRGLSMHKETDITSAIRKIVPAIPEQDLLNLINIIRFQIKYGVKLEYAIKAFKKYSTEPERLILEDAYKYGKQQGLSMHKETDITSAIKKISPVIPEKNLLKLAKSEEVVFTQRQLDQGIIKLLEYLERKPFYEISCPENFRQILEIPQTITPVPSLYLKELRARGLVQHFRVTDKGKMVLAGQIKVKVIKEVKKSPQELSVSDKEKTLGFTSSRKHLEATGLEFLPGYESQDRLKHTDYKDRKDLKAVTASQRSEKFLSEKPINPQEKEITIPSYSDFLEIFQVLNSLGIQVTLMELLKILQGLSYPADYPEKLRGRKFDINFKPLRRDNNLARVVFDYPELFDEVFKIQVGEIEIPLKKIKEAFTRRPTILGVCHWLCQEYGELRRIPEHRLYEEMNILIIKKYHKKLSMINERDAIGQPDGGFFLGSQDVSPDEDLLIDTEDMLPDKEERRTGIIPAWRLALKGVVFVLVGHPEGPLSFRGVVNKYRFVNKQVKSSLHNGLIPIIFISDTLEQRQKGETDKILMRQLSEALKGISAHQSARVMIVYLPFWVQEMKKSERKPVDPEEIQEIFVRVRKHLSERLKYGREVTEKIPLLYGRLVDESNVINYLSQPDIDGVVVGQAAKNVESAINVVKKAEEFAVQKIRSPPIVVLNLKEFRIACTLSYARDLAVGIRDATHPLVILCPPQADIAELALFLKDGEFRSEEENNPETANGGCKNRDGGEKSKNCAFRSNAKIVSVEEVKDSLLYKVLLSIGRGIKSTNNIAEKEKLSGSTVKFELRKLVALGIIIFKKKNKAREYALSEDIILGIDLFKLAVKYQLNKLIATGMILPGNENEIQGKLLIEDFLLILLIKKLEEKGEIRVKEHIEEKINKLTQGNPEKFIRVSESLAKEGEYIDRYTLSKKFGHMFDKGNKNQKASEEDTKRAVLVNRGNYRAAAEMLTNEGKPTDRVQLKKDTKELAKKQLDFKKKLEKFEPPSLNVMSVALLEAKGRVLTATNALKQEEGFDKISRNNKKWAISKKLLKAVQLLEKNQTIATMANMLTIDKNILREHFDYLNRQEGLLWPKDFGEYKLTPKGKRLVQKLSKKDIESEKGKLNDNKENKDGGAKRLTQKLAAGRTGGLGAVVTTLTIQEAVQQAMSKVLERFRSVLAKRTNLSAVRPLSNMSTQVRRLGQEWIYTSSLPRAPPDPFNLFASNHFRADGGDAEEKDLVDSFYKQVEELLENKRLLALDVNGTLIRYNHPIKRITLKPLLQILPSDMQVAFISSSHFEYTYKFVLKKIPEPLRKNIVVYSLKGIIITVFDKKGKPMHLVKTDLLFNDKESSILKRVLEDEGLIKKWIGIMQDKQIKTRFRGFFTDPGYFRDKLGAVRFEKTSQYKKGLHIAFKNELDGLGLGLANIALGGIPCASYAENGTDDLRPEFVKDIKELLKKNGFSQSRIEQIDFDFSSRARITIWQRKITKRIAIEDLIESKDLLSKEILYIGNEFSREGDDQNILLMRTDCIAVDSCQQRVDSKAIKGGVGVEAATIWLSVIARQLSKGMNDSEENTKESNQVSRADGGQEKSWRQAIAGILKEQESDFLVQARDIIPAARWMKRKLEIEHGQALLNTQFNQNAKKVATRLSATSASEKKQIKAVLKVIEALTPDQKDDEAAALEKKLRQNLENITKLEEISFNIALRLTVRDQVLLKQEDIEYFLEHVLNTYGRLVQEAKAADKVADDSVGTDGGNKDFESDKQIKISQPVFISGLVINSFIAGCLSSIYPLLLASSALFLAINVIGAAIIFLATTSNLKLNKGQKQKLLLISLPASILLELIFILLGLSLNVYQLGLLKIGCVFLLGFCCLEYLYPKLKTSKYLESIPYKFFGIIPVSFPLIAGPGVLGLTPVLVSQYGIVVTLIAFLINWVILFVVINLFISMESASERFKNNPWYGNLANWASKLITVGILIYLSYSAIKDLGLFGLDFNMTLALPLLLGAAFILIVIRHYYLEKKQGVRNLTPRENQEEDAKDQEYRDGGRANRHESEQGPIKEAKISDPSQESKMPVEQIGNGWRKMGPKGKGAKKTFKLDGGEKEIKWANASTLCLHFIRHIPEWNGNGFLDAQRQPLLHLLEDYEAIVSLFVSSEETQIYIHRDRFVSSNPSIDALVVFEENSEGYEVVSAYPINFQKSFPRINRNFSRYEGELKEAIRSKKINVRLITHDDAKDQKNISCILLRMLITKHDEYTRRIQKNRLLEKSNKRTRGAEERFGLYKKMTKDFAPLIDAVDMIDVIEIATGIFIIEDNYPIVWGNQLMGFGIQTRNEYLLFFEEILRAKGLEGCARSIELLRNKENKTAPLKSDISTDSKKEESAFTDKNYRQSMAEYIIARYKKRESLKVVEVGVGTSLAVATKIKHRLPSAQVIITDRDSQVLEKIDKKSHFAGLKTVVDDISYPSKYIYENADVIYSMNTPKEIIKSLMSLAQQTQADLILFVSPEDRNNIPENFIKMNYQQAVLYLLLRESSKKDVSSGKDGGLCNDNVKKKPLQLEKDSGIFAMAKHKPQHYLLIPVKGLTRESIAYKFYLEGVKQAPDYISHHHSLSKVNRMNRDRFEEALLLKRKMLNSIWALQLTDEVSFAQKISLVVDMLHNNIAPLSCYPSCCGLATYLLKESFLELGHGVEAKYIERVHHVFPIINAGPTGKKRYILEATGVQFLDEERYSQEIKDAYLVIYKQWGKWAGDESKGKDGGKIKVERYSLGPDLYALQLKQEIEIDITVFRPVAVGDNEVVVLSGPLEEFIKNEHSAVVFSLSKNSTAWPLRAMDENGNLMLIIAKSGLRKTKDSDFSVGNLDALFKNKNIGYLDISLQDIFRQVGQELNLDVFINVYGIFVNLDMKEQGTILNLIQNLIPAVAATMPSQNTLLVVRNKPSYIPWADLTAQANLKGVYQIEGNLCSCLKDKVDASINHLVKSFNQLPQDIPALLKGVMFFKKLNLVITSDYNFLHTYGLVVPNKDREILDNYPEETLIISIDSFLYPPDILRYVYHYPVLSFVTASQKETIQTSCAYYALRKDELYGLIRAFGDGMLGSIMQPEYEKGLFAVAAKDTSVVQALSEALNTSTTEVAKELFTSGMGLKDLAIINNSVYLPLKKLLKYISYKQQYVYHSYLYCSQNRKTIKIFFKTEVEQNAKVILFEKTGPVWRIFYNEKGADVVNPVGAAYLDSATEIAIQDQDFVGNEEGDIKRQDGGSKFSGIMHMKEFVWSISYPRTINDYVNINRLFDYLDSVKKKLRSKKIILEKARVIKKVKAEIRRKIEKVEAPDAPTKPKNWERQKIDRFSDKTEDLKKLEKVMNGLGMDKAGIGNIKNTVASLASFPSQI
jgi:triosephosphate isomerase